MWHSCYCWARKSRSRLLGESAELSHSFKLKDPTWLSFSLFPPSLIFMMAKKSTDCLGDFKINHCRKARERNCILISFLIWHMNFCFYFHSQSVFNCAGNFYFNVNFQCLLSLPAHHRLQFLSVGKKKKKKKCAGWGGKAGKSLQWWQSQDIEKHVL